MCIRYSCVCAQWCGHVQLFATPWTVAHQAPLSMRFSRQEYWSGLPSDTLIWVLQRGSKAEYMSEVFVTGRPLGSFTVTIVLREAWETERSFFFFWQKGLIAPVLQIRSVTLREGKWICQNLKAKQQYRQELETQPNIVSLFTCQFVSFHPSVLKYA